MVKGVDVAKTTSAFIVSNRKEANHKNLKNNVGYVIPYEITDEVAIGFVEYSRAEGIVQEQGQSSFKLASEKYSLEIATSKYLKVFDKVLNNVH